MIKKWEGNGKDLRRRWELHRNSCTHIYIYDIYDIFRISSTFNAYPVFESFSRDAGISTSETYHKGLMIFLFFCHDFPKSLVLLVDLCLYKIPD